MTIRYILKSQANQLFEAISIAGLEPSEFEWKDTGGLYGRQVSQLAHRNSGYYFTFDNSEGFNSSFSPGKETLKEIHSNSGWGPQFEYFRRWLSYVNRETQSPDLWQAISREAQILETAASSSEPNTRFTSEEKEYLFKGLGEIRQYLLTAHKLDPELIESRLKYLVESSERVGRKDWLNLLISVLIGIVITAALPPEATRDLFRFVGSVLRQFIQGPLLLT